MGLVMNVSLIVLTPGKMHNRAVEVRTGRFLIGRSTACHLRPGSPLVSERHCGLLRRDGRVFVRDFESTNGTYVNDQPVKGEVELHNNDSLRIGPLQFRVQIEGAMARPRLLGAGARSSAPSLRDKTSPRSRPADFPPLGSACDEDEAAALLLSLADDLPSCGPLPGEPTDATTTQGATAEQERFAPDPVPSRPVPDAQNGPNTSSAAEGILGKYTRRPRTGP